MSFYTKKQYEQPTMSDDKLQEVVEKIYNGNYSYEESFFNEKGQDLENSYDVDWIEEFGGEGDSAPMEHIWKITEESTGEFGYISFEGEYSSWDANEWNDDYSIVRPTSIVVTKFV